MRLVAWLVRAALGAGAGAARGSSWKGAVLGVLAILALATPARSQPGIDAVAPVPESVPSVNSVWPGTLPVCRSPGCTGREITLYGTALGGLTGEPEVLWNGEVLTSSAAAGREETRLRAVVPAALLATDGTATLAVRRGTALSNAVTMVVGSPPSCAGGGAECGAAIGDVPVVVIVPYHTWTPAVAAPAGGLVRVDNRDIVAQFRFHILASTDLTDPERLEKLASARISPDGRFGVSVPSPTSAEDVNSGYVRIPENELSGALIPFFCPVHGLAMVTPVGGVLVQ